MIIRGLKNTFRLFIIIRILSRHKALFFWRGKLDGEKGKRLAAALEELGPTFVKLGQVLSTRSDLVGQEMALALTELQDRVPPFPSSKVHSIIEKELGKPVRELFAMFDDTPAAAASIAQVHFAVLHDGTEVAVKVLRPDVEEAFARDVALLYWLADVVEWWQPALKRFKLAEVTYTFEEMIKFELDLRFEAAAAVELRENLQYDEGFYVPVIYWNYTSGSVLTLERIKGIPISDVEAIKKAGHVPAELVDKAAISFFNQVFRDGFFHADLHPGNMFVLPDGRIAVVDFGIMGRLDKKSRLYLAQILHGFLKEDYYNLAKVHFDAGFVPAHKSVEKFALAMMAITKPIIGKNLNDISVANLMGQLFTTAETFEMEAQPHLLLLQKNMMLTEGVGRMLNPNVNMWQVVEPLIEAWAHKNLGVKAQIKDKTSEAINLLQSLPLLLRQGEAALAKINDGGLKLHRDTVSRMEHQRRKFHREWLFMGWTAIIIAIVLYAAH